MGDGRAIRRLMHRDNGASAPRLIVNPLIGPLEFLTQPRHAIYRIAGIKIFLSEADQALLS